METSKELTEPDSQITILSDEIKLHIILLGLKDVIQLNSIFDPSAGTNQYIRQITQINKDFAKFKPDLLKSRTLIIITTFAKQEQQLSKEIRNANLAKILSEKYEQSNEEQAARLIIAGADPEVDISNTRVLSTTKRPALVAIADTGYFVNLIPLLISHGANIDATDEWKHPLVLIAVSRNNTYLTELLVARGAKLDTLEYKGKKTVHPYPHLDHKTTASLLIKKHQKKLKHSTEKSSCILC